MGYKINVLIFICPLFIWAQNGFKLSGIIRDQKSGKGVTGVAVIAIDLNKSTLSDTNGLFSLQVPTIQDSTKIVFAINGYLETSRYIKNNQNNLVIEIEEITLQLEQVTIVEDKNKIINSTQMSTSTITAKDIKNIPAFFGEPDILKILQLKPGIQSSGEGSNGIFVRGGGADQNLVILDEAPIYNANHLFGFFSIFNSDLVKSVDIYKGGFPSQYGGRLSSIIDVKLKEGNKQKFSGAGGIGLITSRLTLESPLQKGKSSIFISGRRTYAEILTRQINKSNEGKIDYDPIPDYFFYDLNLKADYYLNKNNKVFLNIYHGRDVFQFGRRGFSVNFNWGNTAITAKWRSAINKKLTMTNSIVYSGYDYKIKNKFLDFSFFLQSKVSDYQFKSDFEYDFNTKNKIYFGINAIKRDFTIGRLQGGSSNDSVSFNAGMLKSANEYAMYLGSEHDFGARWKISNGLRLSSTFNGNTSFLRLEPRFACRYLLNENLSAKASFTTMNQFVHLATNTGASLPTDIWYPTTRRVRPESANQYATGVNYQFGKGKYILSYEIYYKQLRNQIDFKDGARLFVNPQLEEEFIFGRGWAYGNELYIEKKEGKTTGWISYTLAWAWRQFDEINNGLKFRPKNDRRHDISAVVVHQINKRLSISATWVYGTGSLITVPIGKTVFQGIEGTTYQVVPDYKNRNNYRMAAYHRLDLGLVYKFFKKWGESDLTFSIYNAYNRRNPYFVYFEDVRSTTDEDLIVGFKGSQVSLFPILPSITYNFKF